jgi:hypothetical protein
VGFVLLTFRLHLVLTYSVFSVTERTLRLPRGSRRQLRHRAWSSSFGSFVDFIHYLHCKIHAPHVMHSYHSNLLWSLHKSQNASRSTTGQAPSVQHWDFESLYCYLIWSDRYRETVFWDVTGVVNGALDARKVSRSPALDTYQRGSGSLFFFCVNANE